MRSEPNAPRRQAREAALRILYFWEVGQADPREAIGAYFQEHAPAAPAEVVEFASTIVLGTVTEIGGIDALIERHTRHWRLERLAVIDRLILRIGTWELAHRGDTPAPVILNEAIELARRFGTDESVRFVNGVLDAILKTLDAGGSTRPAESS
ncbi:MAG: transcription antitermination factor NusB [Acidobacteria bacterium]|nr:transcription antitermination factor NusB [Acidobacteriota bacterium]